MNIFLADEQDEPLGTAPLRRLAQRVMEAESLPDNTEVSILLVSPSQITTYNERFMNRSGPTDVLAFPLEDLKPGRVPDRPPEAPPFNLGDVVISPLYVRQQADEAGISFEDEISLMLVHGMLHLLGYNHQTDAQATEMSQREQELLAGARGAPR